MFKPAVANSILMIRLNFNETGIEMRSTNFILTVIIILTNSFYISAQPQELDLLVEEAIRLSPKLKMLEAKRLAAGNRIDQKSNLPDPVLTLGIMNLPTNTFSFNPPLCENNTNIGIL